jgi:hypothetical protein
MYVFGVFKPGRQMQHDGLNWFRRRRQRPLTFGVFALFCLAWLQLAALPCANAYATGISSPTAASGIAVGGDQHAMHTMAAHSAAAHCPYCPPDAVRSKAHASCSYPHAPQVDARLATLLGAAMPAPVPLLLSSVTSETQCDVGVIPDAPAVPPRTPLAVRLCRFLE